MLKEHLMSGAIMPIDIPPWRKQHIVRLLQVWPIL
jgi:hypothetical protein